MQYAIRPMYISKALRSWRWRLFFPKALLRQIALHTLQEFSSTQSLAKSCIALSVIHLLYLQVTGELHVSCLAALICMCISNIFNFGFKMKAATLIPHASYAHCFYSHG